VLPPLSRPKRCSVLDDMLEEGGEDEEEENYIAAAVDSNGDEELNSKATTPAGMRIITSSDGEVGTATKTSQSTKESRGGTRRSSWMEHGCTSEESYRDLKHVLQASLSDVQDDNVMPPLSRPKRRSVLDDMLEEGGEDEEENNIAASVEPIIRPDDEIMPMKGSSARSFLDDDMLDEVGQGEIKVDDFEPVVCPDDEMNHLQRSRRHSTMGDIDEDATEEETSRRRASMIKHGCMSEASYRDLKLAMNASVDDVMYLPDDTLNRAMEQSFSENNFNYDELEPVISPDDEINPLERLSGRSILDDMLEEEEGGHSDVAEGRGDIHSKQGTKGSTHELPKKETVSVPAKGPGKASEERTSSKQNEWLKQWCSDVKQTTEVSTNDLDAKIAERKLKKLSAGSGPHGRRTSRLKKGRKKTASSMVIPETDKLVTTAFKRGQSSSMLSTGIPRSVHTNLVNSEAVLDAGEIDEIKLQVISSEPIGSYSSQTNNTVRLSGEPKEDSVLQVKETNDNPTKKGEEKPVDPHTPLYAEDDKKTESLLFENAQLKSSHAVEDDPLLMVETLTNAKKDKKKKKKDNQGGGDTSKNKSEKKKSKLIRRDTISSDERLNTNAVSTRRMSLDDKIITKMASVKNLDISDPFVSKLTIEQKIARKQSVKNLEAVDLSGGNIDDKIAKKAKGEEKKRSRRVRSKSRVFSSLVMSMSSADTEVTNNHSRTKGEKVRSVSTTKSRHHDPKPKKKEKKRSASALPIRRKERTPSYDEMKHIRQDCNVNENMPHINMLQDDPIMLIDSMMDNLREKNRKRTSMLKR